MEAKYHPKMALAGAAVLLAAAFMGASTSAQEDTNNNISVEVNVSEKTIVDIQPKQLRWGQGTDAVIPGSVAGPNDEQNLYGRVQIENLGSVNISQVWLNTTNPTQRPFGTGNIDNYDTGNFISVDSNTSTSDFNQFIARNEFGFDQPADDDIIYLNTPSNWDYGRFRNASQNYFWTVDDETAADIDGARFRIGITPQTESQTGTTDFTSGCDFGDSTAVGGSTDCNGYTLNNVSDSNGNWWAVTEVVVGAQDGTGTLGESNAPTYCAAFDADTVTADSGTDPELYFLKWAKSHPALDNPDADCSFATNYTIGGSDPNLVPGEFRNTNIRAKIPFGTVAGEIPAGEVYVLANSQ